MKSVESSLREQPTGYTAKSRQLRVTLSIYWLRFRLPWLLLAEMAPEWTTGDSAMQSDPIRGNTTEYPPVPHRHMNYNETIFHNTIPDGAPRSGAT